MKVLDLFSGVGGFALGLEKSGFETVAFCEIEPYAQKVLAKHWPGVPIYGDVRQLTADRLAADGIGVDVITGGFPCQDISTAGRQAGIDGERSGLWSEIARLIGELQPRYAIMENVTNLISGDSGRWFGRVLGDLAEIGYDAEWHCIPASAIGANHHRDRVWIVAYPDGKRLQGRRSPILSERDITNGHGRSSGWWASEPAIQRMANGIPNRAHRLRCLGNAVVPQIPELIGRAIMAGKDKSFT
jgi:DNA (cytosine-5)-methyltransferase 1